MCNKNSPLDIQTMKKKKKNIRKQSTKDSASPSSSSSSSLKPLRRRNRTKTRKPKYLSLRLQLSKKTTTQQQQPQLNLFPPNPENTVESEKDIMHEENNVALLFTSDGGATLTGLLEDESTTTAGTGSEEGSYSALTCHSWLVRKAMRKSSREEEEEEERWVCYSEVVEKKEIMEEVTSTEHQDPLFWGGGGVTTSFGLLSLKLDHEGILNAWSDKGSLYVAAEDEAPQLVPNLQDSALPPYVPWEGWGNDAVGNTWKVPEDSGGNIKMTVKEEMGWKLGQREASVLRYKEKRQSRLFAKRIRYEVRKLNAEKRPRMKGRFVKRE